SYLPCPSKKSLAFGHSAIYQTSPRPQMRKSCTLACNLWGIIFVKNLPRAPTGREASPGQENNVILSLKIDFFFSNIVWIAG
ncbi:MAG: hypothetical protein K2O84_02990, partial [Oscillospiraceae bacterium]|nr:hypothetical protein [Oscillospiraceae bacterium]